MWGTHTHGIVLFAIIDIANFVVIERVPLEPVFFRSRFVSGLSKVVKVYIRHYEYRNISGSQFSFCPIGIAGYRD